MTNMRLLVASIALLATPAMAADAYRPSPAITYAAPNWSGFYLGANAGGGWGSNCWTFVGPFDAGCHDTSGPLAGGQVGYNWQRGTFVLGAELSGDWARLTGSNTSPNATQSTDHTQTNSIFMATARAGVVLDRSLIYAKGGAAWVQGEYSITCNGITGTGTCLPVGATPEQAKATRTGWTIGGGLEYLLTQSVSLGVEYDYIGLGTRNVTFSTLPGYDIGCGVGAACPISLKENISVVTGRLNWRFAGP